MKEAKRALALSRESKLAGVIAFGFAAVTGLGCRDSSASNTTAAASPAASSGGAAADVVLPGVDTSAMTPRERHQWSSLVTQLFAPCPNVPVSVAQCVHENRACGGCGQAAKWVARAVREGASDEQVQRSYKARFDPASVKTIPNDGSPTKGPEGAPVTIIEFADFECPHCREAVPMIDAVMTAHPGAVRLIYKSYTLPFHAHGVPAARAAFAAGVQGKFWEMEHLLFERQQNLETSDLERYAQLLKLDIPRWKADMDSADVAARITHDHDLGESLKLKGTPTIYINGRELDMEEDESLSARVDGELGAPGAAANAGPTPSGSSPASSSPHPGP